MPYTKANPPESIKALPDHAQEIWIKAFNAAFKQYDGDESIAYTVAWAAVRKAGYKQDADGKWVKVEGEMFQLSEFGELTAEQIDIPVSDKIDIKKLTDGDPDPMFVTVKALKKGLSGNGFYYSMEILQKIRDQLPIYAYKGHLKDETELGFRFREPINPWLAGEIKNDWLYVKGYIPPEEDNFRKKIALSLKVKPLTVSIHGFLNAMPKGEFKKYVTDYQLLSIDWANPGTEGIPGAQVVAIGSEQKQSKEDTMDRAEIIAGLTLDEIKKERPDLVQSLSSEMANSEEAKKKRETETEKLKTLEAENLQLKTDMLNAHKDKLLGEIKDEKIRDIAKDLLSGESIEKLDANWKLVKEKLGHIERPGMPIVSGKGTDKQGSDFIQERYL